MLKRILLFSLCLAFSFNFALAQEEDLAPLLDKITNQLNSHSNNNWTYKITTRVTQMDKDWQPEKMTISTAIVRDIDGELSGELLKAEEIEDGITQDITSKVREQTRKQFENANKQRAERNDRDSPDDSSEALLPFSEKKRSKFVFNRMDDTAIDGIAVFTIEATAKEKDAQFYEGKFYIDQSTYEVIKAQISPSKNPKFVKEMEMDIDFELLPEGKFFRKRSRTRVDGGILFKRFRVIAEEEYSDVKILDSNMK